MEIIKKKIGIIGGGQLGKMMILAAKYMGFHTTVLDPAADCPCHSISDAHIVADITDTVAIRRLSEETDVMTYEWEHTDAKFLAILEAEGATIYPAAESLIVINDKYTQKKRLQENGVVVPDFVEVSGIQDIHVTLEKYGRLVLKARKGGYDGKGNAFVLSPADVDGAYAALGSGKIPLMAERYTDFVKEFSVLACRDMNGEFAVYPIAENKHENNILVTTTVPAVISEKTAQAAMEMARKVLDVFKGVGMFGIEMFAMPDGSVMYNEVAPRPHNSGHYTIEACVTSQFENHIRAITGLPLGDTTLLRPVCMRNLLGGDTPGKTVITGIDEALAIPGVKAHIYGKSESMPRRKMGHITVTADTVEEAERLADKAFSVLSINGVK